MLRHSITKTMLKIASLFNILIYVNLYPSIVNAFSINTYISSHHTLTALKSSSSSYSAQAELLLKKADLVRIGEDTKFGINANKGVRREAESIIESLVSSKEVRIIKI
jgi:hypothetical protein